MCGRLLRGVVEEEEEEEKEEKEEEKFPLSLFMEKGTGMEKKSPDHIK